MERRFVISEDPCYVSEATDISESILKQRFLNIRFMLMKPVSEIDWSALFSIFIHGEKEQESEEYIVGKCRECGRDVWSDDQAACPHDKRLKPSAWDEWVEKIPYFPDSICTPMMWRDKMKQWLRECPCRR